MSGEDHFLTRWSRRKREVERAETAAELTTSPQTGEAESADSAEPGDTDASAGPPQVKAALSEAEALPRIEDLTVDSDLTAFLREGVPETLKRAALRRAWSLDPAIRDYVSPADYAWDFNDPASIPGFGGRITAAALGSLGQAIDAALGPDLQPGNAGSAQSAEAEALRSAEAEHPSDTAPQALDEAAPPGLPSGPEGNADMLDGTTAEAPGPQTGTDEPPARSPRHGGAVPR